ncbi:MAG TPA: DNA polymerase III subunit gamma/tau, partial [Candidatus Limnocylindria bacterium]|nr:DNA polymerase III subunit gamma/tau [Candidatus Limnocylindria bacterium]
MATLTTDTSTLNLTRKWRSKDFSSIVGQDVSVKILKNSLYLGQFFPVYLFAGQRGCGKTSTARVFAAALNCQLLPEFQKNPKQHTVPCLQCSSCQAMARGNHPDFSEIDAASHTGVDTIRTIIEASQLLPLMGSKKIYLIDEAHMLSKASCNALLKILEEPPQSVVFMLATTDPQKIIETVRSRCFQLLFKAVQTPTLLQHLEMICTSESIAYEVQGLQLIIQETDGSVRDAINLLEQVRFAHPVVTKEAVLGVLGHLDDGHLVELLQIVITQRPAQVLQFLQRINSTRWSADFIWHRFIELLRAALWIKYGVEPDQFVQYTKELRLLLAQCPVDVVHGILDAFYSKEQLFLRTNSKHALLEVILLQLCKKNKKDDNSSTGTPVCLEEVSACESTVQEQESDDMPD